MTRDSRITKDSEPNLFIGSFKIVFMTEVFFFFFFFQKPATIDIGENSQKPEYESFRFFFGSWESQLRRRFIYQEVRVYNFLKITWK